MSLRLGPCKAKDVGTETRKVVAQGGGNTCRGGEWVREVEVGLVGAAGRLGPLSHEA